MLKKINVRQLRLGMHLHSFEGSWADHPFWRNSFVLRDDKDLALARGSSVAECWIDVSLGLDVEESSALVSPSPKAPAAPAQAATDPQTARTSMDDELRRAARLCQTASSQVARMFNDARLGHALDAELCLPLVHEISNSITRNPSALLNLARLKTQDDYSYMHSVAVCALMVALGRQLGLDEAGCREAGMAGLLHDIGKSVIPADLLAKPGKLDDDEFTLVKTHPERGHALLAGGRDVHAGALDVCLHHHERMDGKGYPEGLAGDEISQLARMGAVCDVYDAVTSERPYKAGWDPADAIARMAQWQGHFDTNILNALIRCVGIYPVGSLVRLDSQRIAVVVEQNEHALTRPIVKTFFSLRSGLPIQPGTVDLSSATCSDKIAAREESDAWNARDIAAMWAGESLPKGYRGAKRMHQRSAPAQAAGGNLRAKATR